MKKPIKLLALLATTIAVDAVPVATVEFQQANWAFSLKINVTPEPSSESMTITIDDAFWASSSGVFGMQTETTGLLPLPGDGGFQPGTHVIDIDYVIAGEPFHVENAGSFTVQTPQGERTTGDLALLAPDGGSTAMLLGIAGLCCAVARRK
jgi:hypothetical protein